MGPPQRERQQSTCPALPPPRVGADPHTSLPPLPRYINHSCAPNCVAEVVTFDKEDKIIIISSRRIPKGEEVRRGGVGWLRRGWGRPGVAGPGSVTCRG